MREPAAGIVLQSSVARGTERPDSDVDLTVVTSRDVGADGNELINGTNRGGMIRARRSGIDVDVNRETHAALRDRFLRRGAADWYIFSHGEVLRDPAGLAQDCRALGWAWFARHPRVAAAWEEQNREVARRKADPAHPLRFPTWPDFSRHLATLVDAGPRSAPAPHERDPGG